MKFANMVRLGGSCLVLATAMTSGLAVAQEQPAQAASADDELEEILVTAQRRTQGLQDTPLSISALTAKTLENAGIGRVEDISNALPNVYVAPRELRTTSIAIRGISADLNNPGLDQSVGVYVDGVYMGRAATINSNLFDLERIEVLRGPQGTLYGRNTIAGAVNILTRRPNGDARAAASLSYGNYDAIRANAVVSGPLSGALFASAAVSLDRRDGMVRNIGTGTRLDDLDGLGGRLTLAYDPGGDWDFVLRGDISRDRTHSGAYDIFNNGAFAGTPFADADPEDRVVAQSTDTTQNRDVYGASGEFNLRTGGGTLTSITALRGYKWNNIQDNDYSVLDMLDTGIRERQSQFSQELRFASDAADRFSYVAGLYYYHQSLDTTSLVVIGPDLGIYPTRTNATIRANVDTDSYAAFGRAVYRFTDALSLAAGLRYTHERKTLDFEQIGDPFGVIAANIAPRHLKRSEGKVSPSVSLEWRPRPKLLAYATFSQGYKSGGFNVFSVTPTDSAEYRPESVNNYELGLKSEFLDSRLRINASIFYMDYTDLQQNQLISVGGGIAQFQTSNAAKARSKGFEIELSALPVRQLQLTASYGYVDAVFESFPNANAAGADYTGNRLPLAPRSTLSGAFEWTQPLGGSLQLFLRGEASHRSRLFFASDNAYSSGALTLLNARIGIGSESGAWRLSAWARNLINETYVTNRFRGAVVPGQVAQSLGQPRTYGAEMLVKF